MKATQLITHRTLHAPILPFVPPHSFTLELNYPNQAGMSELIAHTISNQGGELGTIEMLQPGPKRAVRGLKVRARDEDHAREIVTAVGGLEQVRVLEVSDPVFQIHLGGKICVQSKMTIASRETLAMAYTPGVARVSSAIAQDRSKVWSLTAKGNSVAVVSDGTAVLGLGDIGPEAAMPVMEGKAMLFKQFGDIDAYPICLHTRDSDEIVQTVANLSAGFGGINLEDISAPRCFEIEEQLQQRLDIPVFHDDQHGTAVVVLAGLLNALRLTRQKLRSVGIVISGAGAAGIAIAKILVRSGARDVVVCDREGVINKRRAPGLNASKRWVAAHTNPRNVSGSLPDALSGANAFIGVSSAGLLNARLVTRMARKPIIFALANPMPEIMPEEAARAFIVATGRSDYPNQINNVLAFPGIFRGALDCRAGRISEEMKQAAAQAIAECVPAGDLARDYIVPSVFDRNVVHRVAAAVHEVAMRTGLAKNGK
jgi:malate dehydrogenase (oxaloacetate-decarboxylating)